jgi:two-component system cell cycle response regulator
VTVSIGVAEWRGVSDTAESLTKRADQALYAAKRAGRNRVVASAA